MSLLFMDGFDHYDGNIANTVLCDRYALVEGVTLTTTKKRNGTHSIRGTGTGSGHSLAITAPVSRQVLGCGFGFLQDAASDSTTPIVSFLRDNGDLGGVQYNVTLGLNANGSVYVARHSYVGTVLGTSAPGVVTYNVWNHIEVRCLASQTVGQVQVRVNGIEVLNLINQDTTYNSAAEVSSGVSFGIATITGTGSGNNRYVDDIFLWDDQGSVNNTFIGDKRVTILNPDNNTSVAEWTVVGAASPVQAINTTNDGDTSYITASDTVPVTSEFELENPDSSIGQISGVMNVMVAKKVLSGTAIVEQQMVVSGSATSGASHSITDTYGYIGRVHELNPNTGMPWTNSSLASARLRLRRTT